MKIEIGESLLLSWLKHIKECQIAQTNWKASYKWEMKNRETLEQLMQVSNNFFSQKYGYEIYRQTKSLDQLIGQAEIDVMGINYEEERIHIYGVDVAFHEGGLNYGPDTVAKVIKKCLRTAMCIYGFFGFKNGTIVFASPKINPSVDHDLQNCVDDISLVLKDVGLDYKIRVIGNDDFNQKILEPLLNILGNVADTSELFMRSLQMYNMFASKKPRQSGFERESVARKVTPDLELIESQGLEGLEEMKIGMIANTVLRKVLEEGKVSKEEIEQMQNKNYSKEAFDIQFPLLQKVALTQGKKPERYYASPLKIYGEEYFLCSEWFEVPMNNDRPYLMKWLGLHNGSRRNKANK